MSTTATQASVAGVYDVNASGGEDDDYRFVYQGSALTIGDATQAIIFNQHLNDIVFGQESIELNATTTSGLSVYYNSSKPSIAEVNGTTLFIKSAGEVTLSAHQDGNGHFLAAQVVNRSFEIKDITPPVITLIGSSVIYHEAATPYIDEGAQAMDSLEGDLTEFIETNSTVNVKIPGNYHVTFNLIDGHENEAATVTRLVIVEDTTAPSLIVHGGESLSVQQLATEGWLEGAEDATEEKEEASGLILELTFATPSKANGLNLPDGFPVDAIEYVEALALGHEESLVVWESQSEPYTEHAESEEQDDPTNSSGEDAPEVESTEEGNGVDQNASAEQNKESIDYDFIPEQEQEEESSGEEQVDASADSEDASIDPDEIFEPEPDLTWEQTPFATHHLHLALKPGISLSETLQMADFVLHGTFDNVVVLEAGQDYVDPGFHSDDTVDGEITDKVEVLHELKVLVPDSYYVQYEVEDQAGNHSFAGRMVQVVDHSAPLLEMRGEQQVEVTAGHHYVDEGAWAVDLVDGNLSTVIFTDNSVNVELPGTYEVTYVVSDSRGNLAEITRQVVVKDWDSEELDIILEGDFVTENAPTGEMVGSFFAVKPGQKLEHQFRLVDGEGSADNALFSIEDGHLRVTGQIDFEEKPDLAIRVESISATDARFQKTFTVRIGDAQVPTVVTGQASEVGETTAHLSGSLIDDGGNPIFRIGFELSETPFGQDENQSIVFISLDHADEIIAHIQEILPETNYHFRAVAENAEGIGHGESSTFRTENASALYGAIGVEGKRNWLISDWFGEVYRTDTPWIYHSELGWLYMVSEDQYSIWLWSKDLGWVWTTVDTYPYLYRFSDGAWLNFAFFTEDKRIFYNYLTESWELYDVE